jgi:hypothetical protein
MKMPAPRHIDYFLGKRALKKIQSVEDSWMYQDVTLAALHMATAGCLDEANELLECLWKHKWPHTEDVWLPDQSFEVLWFAAGKRPSTAPFPQKSIDEIELAHREYMALDRWLQLPMPNGSWETLAGLDLFRKSCFLVHPKDDSNSMPDAGDELEGLKGLEKWIQDWDNRSWGEYATATSLGAELAAKNGQNARATHFAQLWARKYSEVEGGGFSFPCMGSNRHIAPLLLQGILSEPLGLTKASCQLYLKNLKAAVDARMKCGRKLAYGKWTWEKLLTSASKRAIKAKPDLFTKDERKSKWLGRPSATNAAIAAAEKRLNVKLPSDYTDFLRTSNGLGAMSSIAPALIGTEKIDWLKNSIDSEMLNILKEYPGEDFSCTIESSILISELKETDMVLLIPPYPGNDLWQCWFFAHWVPGEMRFPSFRHYLEQTFQNLQTEAVV